MDIWITCIHFNTIYLYIILKRMASSRSFIRRFNTIYLYIILKPHKEVDANASGFNTIYLYIILKLPGVRSNLHSVF